MLLLSCYENRGGHISSICTVNAEVTLNGCVYMTKYTLAGRGHGERACERDE